MGQFFLHVKLAGKQTLLNKGSLFWMFIYPILLVTMMALAFRGVGSGLEPIRAAIEPGHPDEAVLLRLELIVPDVLEWEEAHEALERGEVSGIFRADGSLLVGENNLEARILSDVAAELARARTAAGLGIRPDFSKSPIRLGDQPSDLLFGIISMTLAMFSLYSYFSGLVMTEHLQANQSPLAARLSTTPLSRPSYLAAGLLINTALSFFEMILLTLYLRYAWRLDYWVDGPRTWLLLFTASLFGITLGLLVGASVTWSTRAKIPLGIAVTLVLGGLGGMMGADLRLLVDRHAPWLNRYNPVNVIGRLLYRLNALNTSRGYGTGLLALLAASLLFFATSLLFLRRRPFRSL